METVNPAIMVKELPIMYNLQLGDFINKLLRKNVNHRLGSKGIREIKLHGWIKDIQWSKIRAKTYQSPCHTSILRRPQYEEHDFQLVDSIGSVELANNL